MEIGFQWIRVSLRAYGGEAPTGNAFFLLLGVEPFEEFRVCSSESAWQAARLELFSVDIRDLEDQPLPYEEFAAQVEKGFKRVARWLANCQLTGLDQWRASGKAADVF